MNASLDYSGHDHDDGVTGPVGQQFATALTEASAARGFSAVPVGIIPRNWVSQAWQGRELVIGPSPIGSRAMTTGYRWIAIRLSTRRLGPWANPPSLHGDPAVGVGLPLGPPPGNPTGFYADDPRLLDWMASFVPRVLPPGYPFRSDVTDCWIRLHARNDAVVWHVRAQRLNGPLLVEAIDLLAAVAGYGEAFDQRLTLRLGEASGVTRHRNVERVLLFAVAGLVLACILLFGLLAAASWLG